MHTRMEEQGIATVDQSQHIPGNQDFDQFEGRCDGWRTCLEFGEREREGFPDWHCMVDVDCCTCYVYQFYGMQLCMELLADTNTYCSFPIISANSPCNIEHD